MTEPKQILTADRLLDDAEQALQDLLAGKAQRRRPLIALLTYLLDKDALADMSVYGARRLAHHWLSALPDVWIPVSDLELLMRDYWEARQVGNDHNAAVDHVIGQAQFDQWLREKAYATDAEEIRGKIGTRGGLRRLFHLAGIPAPGVRDG